MKLRKIGKMTRPNDGNRSFYESILNRHILTALKYLSHNNSEYVIIGDLAVSYHVKPFMCKKIQIVVHNKNKSVFKYFPNNICRGIELHIEDISSLNITEEQYRYIIDTARKSDGFSIASPTVLVSLCLENFNVKKEAEAYTICTNNPIKINELFGYQNKFIEFIYSINYDYCMKYLKNFDEYFQCRIFEGTSGHAEVDNAFKDWVNRTSNVNQVLIGGMAIVNCDIERTTADIDFLFLSFDEIPKEVQGFKKHRGNAFQHNKTHVEVEVLAPEKISIEPEFAELIFKTAHDKGKFKIASPSGIAALKLSRFSKRDKDDIISLIQNYEVDISIYKPYLSEDEISNYEICLKQATKKED